MTSLIRGFDESLRNMIRELGPNTIILSKADALSLASGADFSELMRRPNLTVDDARAIERLAPSVGVVDIWMGQGLGGQTAERVFYGGERTPTRGGPRRDRAVRHGQLRQAVVRTLLHRVGSAAPTAGRRPGQQPVSGAVRAVGHRSDRQEGPRRRDRVHGRRRPRQASVAVSAGGQLRRHSADHAPGRVRHQRATGLRRRQQRADHHRARSKERRAIRRSPRSKRSCASATVSSSTSRTTSRSAGRTPSCGCGIRSAARCSWRWS